MAVLHDVLLFELLPAVTYLRCHHPAWSYRTAHGAFPNYVGTGLLASETWAEEVLADLGHGERSRSQVGFKVAGTKANLVGL